MDGNWQPSPGQREILGLKTGRHLVLAPPGTGKTELLAWRVRDVLRAGMPPNRILCLTFTVRAADAMTKRIQSAVPRTRLPELGNFHHWCHWFLRNRGLVPGNWQVVDEILQADLMGEALDQVAAESASLGRQMESLRDRTGRWPIADLLAHAARCRQQDLQFPEDILDNPRGANAWGTASPELLRLIAKTYRRRKESLRLLDYDDLLLYAYWFVAIKKAIPNSEKCTWVQIDEVQDLNPLQWGLVQALSAPGAHQVFFGDVEQSIFSFRGATSPHLARIAATCDGIHLLARNYRSRSYLLDLTVRYALKTLHADWTALPVPSDISPPAPGALRLVEVPDGTPHEDWLAHFLLHERESAPSVFPRTAILVRTNRRADDVEKALRSVGLPVYKVSGTDWSARPEARDFKSFLSVLVNPGDRMAWARLFRLFAGIPSHAAARNWTADLFAAGLRPSDLLAPEPSAPDATPLDDLSRMLAAPSPSRIVVFDTETTGLDANREDIIQLAAVELLGERPVRTFNRYLFSNRDLSATEPIHHISRAILDASGVPPADALRDFVAFVGKAPLAGHNVSFDRNFLAAALKRHGLPPLPPDTVFIDTLDASRRLYPNLKSHKLADLIEAFRLAAVNSHNAVDDVDATAKLLLRLSREADARANARRTFLRIHANAISRFREAFLPLWNAFTSRPGRHGNFRYAWSAFLDAALAASAASGNDAFASRGELDAAASKFLLYADCAWGDLCKKRTFL